MANNKKSGRVIIVSKEDKILFKKYVKKLKEIGIDKMPIEMASDCFSIGLHDEYEMLSNSKQ